MKKDILAMIISAGILIGGLIAFDKYINCPQFGKAVELETHYSVFGGGCFVKTENKWVQRANYWNSPIKK